MSSNTAPDSWESQADSASANNSPTQTADVTAKFSTLNVNAVEFVPSFAMPAASIETDSPTESKESENSPEHSPIVNGMKCFCTAHFFPCLEVRLSRFVAIWQRFVSLWNKRQTFSESHEHLPQKQNNMLFSAQSGKCFTETCEQTVAFVFAHWSCQKCIEFWLSQNE